MIVQDVCCINSNENSAVKHCWLDLCVFYPGTGVQGWYLYFGWLLLLLLLQDKIIFLLNFIHTFDRHDRLFHTGPCFTKSRLLFAAFWKITVVVTQTGRVVSKFFLGFFVDLHQRFGHTSQYIVALVQTWFGIGIVLFALHEINVLRPALLSD